MCDLDTLCYSLYAPVEWAKRAAMPDMRQHFACVADQFTAQQKDIQNRTRNIARPDIGSDMVFDMARSASEIGL